MLVFAGLDLAISEDLTQGSRDKLPVIIITGLVCLFFNVALGLLIGIAIEYLYQRNSNKTSDI
jgi:MFS superfamily sulfate permease-like transporter